LTIAKALTLLPAPCCTNSRSLFPQRPGSLITHFENIQYAGLTFLGAMALTATFAATFYTTASEAMVAPKLKMGEWTERDLTGSIMSQYANINYVVNTCPSVSPEEDGEAGRSCTAIGWAGQSYRNLMSFMGTWSLLQDNQTDVSSNIQSRPIGSMLLYDNTTVYSTWIETSYSDVAEAYERTGHIVNNVTLAVPHPGESSTASIPILACAAG
jgi:hypothetical protein